MLNFQLGEAARHPISKQMECLGAAHASEPCSGRRFLCNFLRKLFAWQQKNRIATAPMGLDEVQILMRSKFIKNKKILLGERRFDIPKSTQECIWIVSRRVQETR